MEEKYREIIPLLTKTFDYELTAPEENLSEEDFINQAIDKLTPVVEHLLEKDFNRLLAILYRIDVQEARLNECLNGQNMEEVSRCIARAVVQRQVMKIKLRNSL